MVTSGLTDAERADAIRTRLAASTPGPWEIAGWHDRTIITERWARAESDGADLDTRGPFMSATATSDADADLIANAPADLAWGVEQYERAERAERERDESVHRLGEQGTPAILWKERAERAEERIAKARAAATYLGSAGTGVIAALDGDPAQRNRIDDTSLG